VGGLGTRLMHSPPPSHELGTLVGHPSAFYQMQLLCRWQATCHNLAHRLHFFARICSNMRFTNKYLNRLLSGLHGLPQDRSYQATCVTTQCGSVANELDGMGVHLSDRVEHLEDLGCRGCSSYRSPCAGGARRRIKLGGKSYFDKCNSSSRY
jgi:hypothetical protein